MSALPENWEWDYDGERQRWFYRYKPTGITQFHFPQPGDEFPQTIDDGAPIDLEPEERLVSQLQVKRRSTVGEKTSTAKTKNTLASATIAEDDGSNAPWFQPDVFMYMGPGAYDDISPLQEDEDDLPKKEDSKTTQEKPPVSAPVPAPVPSPAPPPTSEVSPQQSTISPLASAQTTPLVVQSLPVIEVPPVIESPPVIHNQPPVRSHTVIESQSVVHQPVVETQPIAQNPPPRATQEIDSVQIVEVHGESAPVVDSIPLLDSRQVAYTPVGFMAELPSELTGQCHEDINPTPVELPGNDIMMDTGPPLLYANAFPLAPSELHSDAIPPSRRQRQGDTEKALLSGSPSLDAYRQQPSAYGATHQTSSASFQPPVRQNSMPQPVLTSAQLDSAKDPYQGQYRPWNPTMHAVAEEVHKQAPAGENKRHSLAGPPPSNWRRPEIPAALSAPMVSPKKPADPAEESTQTPIPGYGARHGSISAPAQPGNASGLSHVPSVLQPARGRPVLSKSSPQSQSPPSQSPPKHSTDTNQRYTAYKPTSWDLQRDIEETVEMLSRTGYGQAAPDPSGLDRPALPRTSTAPGDSKAGPYYAMRPPIPPSAPGAPSALQNVQSQPALSYHYSISEASTTRSSDFSAPLPPSSPDLPEPLKLTRKSPPPPPAPQNNLPTVSSTLRPPAPPTEVYIVSRETTPAPLSNPTATFPTMQQAQAARSQDPISPPQTPPLLFRLAKTTSTEPALRSFSVRAFTWGEGQQVPDPSTSHTVTSEPLTKISSDPVPLQVSSPDATNIYTIDHRSAMPTSEDAGAPPQSIFPRESSLSRVQEPQASGGNKRQSLPPSTGLAPWQSQYSRPGVEGSNSGGYMHFQPPPVSAEVLVRHGPPRPPKTPHAPEPHRWNPQTPPPSSAINQGSGSGSQSLPRDQSPHSPMSAPPQSTRPPEFPSNEPYVLPAGHHPLSSHPVNLSHFTPSGAPVSTRPSHQSREAISSPPFPMRNNRYSMLINPSTSFFSPKPPVQGAPSTLSSEQSVLVTTKRQSMVGSPPISQPLQPVGYTPNQPGLNIDERVPPGLVPERTASLRRATPQSNRSSPGVPEGLPPPQKYMAYTPPTSPPSATTGSFAQSTNTPPPQDPQLRVVPQPQPQSQPQPFTRPHPQPIASPPPQQEPKGSFFSIGKLFRSDSLRKGGSNNTGGTKLQKNAAKVVGGQLPPSARQQQQSQPGRTPQMNAPVQHQPVQPAHHTRQYSQPLPQQYQPLNYPPFPQQQWQGFNGGISGVHSGAPVQGGQGGQGGPFFGNAGGGSGFGGGSHRPVSMMVAPTTGGRPAPVTNNSHDGSGAGAGAGAAGRGYQYR